MLEISINQAKPELAKFLRHIDKGEDVLVKNDKGQSYFIVAMPVISKKAKPFQNNVQKLKGIIKTDIHLSIDEMNNEIAKAGAKSAS